MKLAGIVVGLLVLGLLFPLFGAAMGAFSGWVVGLFFSETILGFLATFGIKGFAMWQVGLSLGFIGGFFRSSHTINHK
jgi:hypothetical protein